MKKCLLEKALFQKNATFLTLSHFDYQLKGSFYKTFQRVAEQEEGRIFTQTSS